MIDTMDDADGKMLDRGRGTLLGLAVGDALGTTLEFSQRDASPLQTEMTGGGPFGLQPGEWTDDTAMALALADSLATCGEFNPRDLMRRIVAWWREGRYSCTGTCFDIGLATARALARFERTAEPFAGSTSESDAGNGSLMRVAPVALFALDDANFADRIARDQSRTTHGAPQTVEACAFFTQILRSAILGAPDPLRPADWRGHPTVTSIASGSFRTKAREEIRSTGYVIDTLEAALWCIATTSNFEDALVLAVNLADDADTVGAITGQIAGAIYGASAIPSQWLQRLAGREKIEVLADQLLKARIGSTRHQ